MTATAAGRDIETPEAGVSPAVGSAPSRHRHSAAGRSQDGPPPRGGQPTRGGLPDRPTPGGPASPGMFFGLRGTPEPEPPPRSKGAFAGRFGILAVAIGVVMALIAMPVAAGVGLFSKASADHYLDLPSVLATPPLPQNSEILAADGSVIATLHGAENRIVVDAKQIPTIMRQAIVAIEDARFYEHGGFDPKGVLRAALHNSQAGEVTEGASTLTQQYVKNVLVQNATTDEQRRAATSASVSRKIQELRYASALEKQLTKDQILTNYLNIAYFGDGAYGVGTAAQHFFGVDVSKLTLDQAALLAGLVQSPSRYNPRTNPKDATTRRGEVLDAMVASKYISQTQADAAKQMPIRLNITSGTSVDSCQESKAPFFCDYVRTTLSNDKALGSTKEERQRRLYEGGLVIHTTLDPKVQAAAQNAVDSTMGKTNRASATEVVIEPGTGNILAIAVNQNYGSDASHNQTKINLATKVEFKPGSTMKLFTMIAALEQGYGLSTAFYSPACYESEVFILDRGQGDCAKGFQNSDPAEAGVYDMSKGTWDSVNTYFIQLEEKVGVMNVVKVAEELGIPDANFQAPPIPVGPTVGDVTIGHYAMSPMQMATAYAAVAAGGKVCTPRFVNSATDSAHENVNIAPKPDCRQALDEDVANTAASVLAGVVTQGTGTNARVPGHQVAGKTGTNDAYSSAWFIGFTPQMASAVVVGDWHGSEGAPLVNIQADGRTWSRVFGGDLPALIFSRTLIPALADKPSIPLPRADPKVAQGTKGGLMNTPPPPTASPGMMIDPLTGQPIPLPGFPGQASVTPTAPTSGDDGGTSGGGVFGGGGFTPGDGHGGGGPQTPPTR